MTANLGKAGEFFRLTHYAEGKPYAADLDLAPPSRLEALSFLGG